MRSRELAEDVQRFVSLAQGRIEGTGNEQYSLDEGQLFETMTRSELIEYVREELLDTINYSVMMLIRLERLEEGLQWLE